MAWTEALTLISQTHAPDDVYAQLKAQFSEEEQVKLTMLIVTINAWNRLAIGFRKPHPVEQPAAKAAPRRTSARRSDMAVGQLESGGCSLSTACRNPATATRSR